MVTVRAYWNPKASNFGDTLTPIILRHLGYSPQCVGRDAHGKVLAVGSIMNALRERDVVWGTGVQFDQRHTARSARFLAVRGPITRSCIDGARVPAVYGDPALLLPAVYDPEVETVRKTGYMPHYKDRSRARARYPSGYIIDVSGGWRKIIRQMKACEHIVTTSLHGIIAADAYGIPCTWEASYSGRLVSGNLKFQDHFLGTGRDARPPGPVPMLDRGRYAQLCDGLTRAAAGLPA